MARIRTVLSALVLLVLLELLGFVTVHGGREKGTISRGASDGISTTRKEQHMDTVGARHQTGHNQLRWPTVGGYGGGYGGSTGGGGYGSGGGGGGGGYNGGGSGGIVGGGSGGGSGGIVGGGSGGGGGGGGVVIGGPGYGQGGAGGGGGSGGGFGGGYGGGGGGYGGGGGSGYGGGIGTFPGYSKGPPATSLSKKRSHEGSMIKGASNTKKHKNDRSKMVSGTN